ncbi:MAG TPA: creatininase [Candidatus Sulfotelmatobacter sp.]|nr:creatininase [Candidatus Sulfotelmatobacter sp.]
MKGNGTGTQLMDRMTWEEAALAIKEEVPVLIPVGSIEQHGPHMPLGTDAYLPLALARRVGEQRRVVIAPPMFYGARPQPRSGGGGRVFPGTTGVSNGTLTAVVRDVADDLFRQGFQRVAVLNGHWENAPAIYEALEAAMEPYLSTHKALLINWWELITNDDLKAVFPSEFPGWEAEHAGIAETSLMEDLLPEMVDVERKVEGGGARLRRYDVIPLPPDAVPPTGVPWKSTLASPKIGADVSRLLVERIVAILDEEFVAATDHDTSRSGRGRPSSQAPTEIRPGVASPR